MRTNLKTRAWTRVGSVLLASSLLGLLIYDSAFAHCDSIDGPVVKAGKVALSRGDIVPALRWIRPEDEAELRATFKTVLAIRGKSAETRQVADRYFFETLVRLHRAGEGEPFTGIKPAGTPVPEAIKMADRSLETGSVDDLAKTLAAEVGNGIRKRFARARSLAKTADSSVSAGRESVAAYVEFMHYVERIEEAAAGPAGHGSHGDNER